MPQFKMPEFCIPDSLEMLSTPEAIRKLLQCCHYLDNEIDKFASRLATAEERLAELGLGDGASDPESPNPKGVANQGVPAGRVFPSWLPKHSTTQQTYLRHIESLEFEPTAKEIEAKIEPLVITRLWSKTDAANRLECSPQQALAWLYLGKILGFFEFVEGKRVYKRIK